MKARVHDARRLDVAAFAADGGRLDGRWPMRSFERVIEDHPDDAPAPDGEVAWSVRGERRVVGGGEAQVWLQLALQGQVWRTCQRCLRPVAIDLDVVRPLRFVRSEDEAAALDAETDDDVLALERSLDLHALVEDELLLAQPLVPRHDTCPVELPTSVGEAPEAETDKPNPFAALEALKRRH